MGQDSKVRQGQQYSWTHRRFRLAAASQEHEKAGQQNREQHERGHAMRPTASEPKREIGASERGERVDVGKVRAGDEGRGGVRRRAS